MKRLMLGNEAAARGLFEAGCRFISSYPGTPSTEITEFAAKYDEIYAEWAPNEKVAFEAALGAATAGARSACVMKHVGLNVAADPLFVSSYAGINGGMVICVADDPGMHSSQNEQDSRHYARAAKLPMLEPSDSAECKKFIKLAFEISERFSVPVLFRLSTRVAHSQDTVEEEERNAPELKEYEKDAGRRVMIPANAQKAHVRLEETISAIKEAAPALGLYEKIENGSEHGIITAGISYEYAREVFGKDADYLKLDMPWPLNDKELTDFASAHKKVTVIEDLEPFIESHLRSLGINPEGKDKLPVCGEYSQELLNKNLRGIEKEYDEFDEPVPPRPPVLCPGCPHRGIYFIFKKLGLYVSGDIGCYTLGAVTPLESIDTTFCMGASISALHGYNKVRPESAKKSVAVIGDSTFMHSGITGLCDIAYNKGISTVCILDNRITGMTGHQQNPTTGLTLKGESTPMIMPEDIARSLGFPDEHIRIVDPAQLDETEKVIKEELEYDGPSVIIARRPCALLKYVKREPALKIDADKCKSCRSCMRIGCPAISVGESGKMQIDAELCVGCGLCSQLCRFDAINKENKEEN